jgi:hypothetical protein
MGLDPGYVRRVLLRVLDGEEYQGILDHYNARTRLEVKPGVPEGKRPTLLNLRKVHKALLPRDVLAIHRAVVCSCAA